MKLASSKDCTACMACVDSCGTYALGATVNQDGYFAITVNQNKCVSCGRCTNVCPVLNINQPKGNSKPYAVWDTVSDRRKQSASGGAFAAIASVILKRRGSVYGAAIDGFDIKHERITEELELPILQGSKYQHSDMRGIYRQVQKDLREGKYVLFSGLSCQVAGLLSFLKGKDTSKLYTIDTICGGLSTMLPMSHLKESGKYKGINSFRDKENGWKSIGFRYSLKMITTDNAIENLGLDNIVLNTFSSKLLKRSSCLDCKFTGLHRLSDCTIGDFWGDKRFTSQHSEGVSVLAVHNPRICELLNESKLELSPITWNEVVDHNHNFYWTHYPLIRKFPSRKIALKAMQNDNFPLAMKQMHPKTIPGLLLRIYLKINEIQRRKYFTKMAF